MENLNELVSFIKTHSNTSNNEIVETVEIEIKLESTDTTGIYYEIYKLAVVNNGCDEVLLYESFNDTTYKVVELLEVVDGKYKVKIEPLEEDTKMNIDVSKEWNIVVEKVKIIATNILNGVEREVID